MEINHEHVVSFFTGALALWGVLKASAPHTKTTKDDELIAAGERLKAWTDSKARAIWPLVELAAASSKLPAGVAKAIYALEMLKRAFREAHGSDLPKVCEETAREIWAQISIDQKK